MMSVTPSPQTKPVQTSSVMTNLQQLEPEYKRYPVPKLTKAETAALLVPTLSSVVSTDTGIPTCILCEYGSHCPQQTTQEHTMRSMYEVTLHKRGLVHLLADDVEDAAWQALELAKDDILVDVCPLNETE